MQVLRRHEGLLIAGTHYGENPLGGFSSFKFEYNAAAPTNRALYAVMRYHMSSIETVMESIEIKKLESVSELRELVGVFSRAFESEYSVDDAALAAMLENPGAIRIGACVEGKIVGGVVAFEILPIHGSKELYLYDIGVDPQYQRHGVGAMLVARLKEEAMLRGVKSIFVDAESEDEGAVAFYRTIGAKEVTVNHFYIDL